MLFFVKQLNETEGSCKFLEKHYYRDHFWMASLSKKHIFQAEDVICFILESSFVGKQDIPCCPTFKDIKLIHI